MANSADSEAFRPPDNLPPGSTLWSRWLFNLRPWLDLQSASIRHPLIPWLQACRGQILEVGCGAQPYRHYLSDQCVYRGLDWTGAPEHFNYSTQETEWYQGDRFPIETGWAEHLFHTEVLEHVWDTAGFLAECQRVLRPGGTLFFTIPFQARYHYIPFDYWRLTPASLERLLQEAGFHEIQVRPRGTDITVLAYKLISVVYRAVLSRRPVPTLAGLACLPLFCAGLILGHVSLRWGWGSEDDTLGYVVTAIAPGAP
ncbi:hypothetical protein SIID45300_02119 [Candidatus Magnetaquicoccaceae bacterium FCR-1]|uniref:Methyltransferase type 11 domain-containing protein n=1 Tax=Candidatus Magnetaquiglobus chichijimensis TaxID=3141448 RepID=A0ABQ0CA83_9PROT